jgi:hypothetical protein
VNKYKEGECTICEQHFSLLHWHHTVPQALGGKDSLQIPLCSQCHNLLHANAEAVVAFHRNGKKITRNFWKSTREENNAQPWLEILVSAIESAHEVVGKNYVMQFRATARLHRALQLFKMDSGVTSLDKAVILAISEFLKAKGYLNEQQRDSKDNQPQGSGNAQKAKTCLW